MVKCPFERCRQVQGTGTRCEREKWTQILQRSEFERRGKCGISNDLFLSTSRLIHCPMTSKRRSTLHYLEFVPQSCHSRLKTEMADTFRFCRLGRGSVAHVPTVQLISKNARGSEGHCPQIHRPPSWNSTVEISVKAIRPTKQASPYLPLPAAHPIQLQPKSGPVYRPRRLARTASPSAMFHHQLQ